ncbi:MAG: methyltransferase domain-containing protein [Rhodanobacter sp.]
MIAVREHQIESRRLVTDGAIIQAVLSVAPKSVLDIGCGEGWLTRVLAGEGISVTGVDAVPDLIELARQADNADAPADHAVMSYERIAAGELKLTVDAVVCNFALLGKESVEGLFGAMH